MAIYLKYGSIKGPVTTEGFKDWIECASFQWGVGRAIGTAARGSYSREHSEPSINEITLTKATDVASPKLLLDAVAGKLDNKVEIKFTTTAKGKVETYLAFKLENTGISHYSMTSSSDRGGAGGEMPVEHLSLNFTKITKTFTGMDPGLSGSPETVGYDLTQMKTI